MNSLLRVIFLAVLVCLPAFADESADDITKALDSLTGITYREVVPPEDTTIPAGYRRFEITIEQPVDHSRPSLGRFRQRLALLHKSFAEPMVLHTSGYKIFSVKLSALAKGFGTNQLQIEHRFFDQSVPAVLGWNKLDIVQSANDFHRITSEFKKIFTKRWVNTGASKGGMTSSYHRRFFPDDLDGTVADVAPMSYTTDDPRYISFVNEAGGEKYRECREKLRDLQIALLQRRAEILGSFTGSFVYLGGKSVAYEHAVIELPFAFWQYKNPEDPKIGCAKVPAPDASAKDLAAYLDQVSPPNQDTDVFLFMPYFFQAATQLGSPASDLTHLDPYRLHDYSIGQYTPPGVAIPYSDAAMHDVEKWIRTEAHDILFVYGEFDPWSAGAYPDNAKGKNFLRLFVPGGNHGSNLFALAAPEKEKALQATRAWLGKHELVQNHRDLGETLDEYELNFRRLHHLP